MIEKLVNWALDHKVLMYVAARQRANSFNGTLMANARQVLQGKLYAYHRGETSLLEVLNAQRTYNEVQQAYAECLHESLVAWVELYRATGLTRNDDKQ